MFSEREFMLAWLLLVFVLPRRVSLRRTPLIGPIRNLWRTLNEVIAAPGSSGRVGKFGKGEAAGKGKCQGRNQVHADIAFEHVAGCAKAFRRGDEVAVHVHGHEHDARRIRLPQEFGGDVEAADAWHRDVEDHGIRFQSGRTIQRRLAVSDRSHDLEIACARIWATRLMMA